MNPIRAIKEYKLKKKLNIDKEKHERELHWMKLDLDQLSTRIRLKTEILEDINTQLKILNEVKK